MPSSPVSAAVDRVRDGFRHSGQITVEQLFEENHIRQKLVHKLSPEGFRQRRLSDRDQIAL